MKKTKYPTLRELKQMVVRTGVSIVDMPWNKLGPGQMVKLLQWELARDKKFKKRGKTVPDMSPRYRKLIYGSK